MPSTNYLGNTLSGAGSGAAAGAAFGPYGAAIGGGLGALSSAYGSYLQSQQADADYQRALQAWHAEQERQARMDAQGEQQRHIQNAQGAGQYAHTLSRGIEDPYIAYARALGL